MWTVKCITDKGPSRYFRFHVSGVNGLLEVPAEFHWSVSDLDDGRYALASDADARTRELFALARDPRLSKRR